jgi:cbb3-type cytochrome oxidase maturation protein
MHIIFFMIGVSLLIALGFLAALIWAMRTGQQDDLYTPALRMLTDDTLPDVSNDPATPTFPTSSPTTR